MGKSCTLFSPAMATTVSLATHRSNTRCPCHARTGRPERSQRTRLQSRPPLRMYSPPGSHAQAEARSVCLYMVHRCPPVAASQSLMQPWSPQVTSREPLGSHAHTTTLSWSWPSSSCSSSASQAPAPGFRGSGGARRHTATPPSLDAEARRRPSSANAKCQTSSPWLSSTLAARAGVASSWPTASSKRSNGGGPTRARAASTPAPPACVAQARWQTACSSMDSSRRSGSMTEDGMSARSCSRRRLRAAERASTPLAMASQPQRPRKSSGCVHMR
mmetsp:Transcript_21519/g.72436  ORF Transcript_21519/g.72436 Transcript_21519/m.72436 type:complete len:274 (-) Transcript_21519:363-1184(-)